jgi:fructokinase
VDIDAAGAARYRFYLAGTSSAALEYPLLTAALPDGMTTLHAGTLALVMEPIATSIERLITTGLPAGTLVMIDPNCRPGAIADKLAYQARLSRLLRRADVVKVSVEDLAYLYPGATVRSAAATVLGQGARLVLVTDGPRPARAFLPGQELTVNVPAVPVVDTIGAGDAFGGAFLAWWSGNELTKPDLQRLTWSTERSRRPSRWRRSPAPAPERSHHGLRSLPGNPGGAPVPASRGSRWVELGAAGPCRYGSPGRPGPR